MVLAVSCYRDNSNHKRHKLLRVEKENHVNVFVRLRTKEASIRGGKTVRFNKMFIKDGSAEKSIGI